VKKAILSFTILIFTVVGVWFFLNNKELNSFRDIISSYYAKEFCSCTYILKRDENFCKDLLKQWVPISEISIDNDLKTIKVTGLGKTNTAKYTSPEIGCHLE
jgi:hypothetical protein